MKIQIVKYFKGGSDTECSQNYERKSRVKSR